MAKKKVQKKPASTIVADEKQGENADEAAVTTLAAAGAIDATAMSLQETCCDC